MSDSAAYPVNWNLDSLYPHPETSEFRVLLEQLQADLGQLAAESEDLPSFDVDPGRWREFLDRMAETFARYDDLSAFIGCHAAADAGNKLFQRIEGVLSALGPRREQTLTNVELGLKTITEHRLETIASGHDGLSEILFFLQECRRNAELRLPKQLELLAADLSVDGIHAWGRVYDRLSGDLRIQLMEQGEVVLKSPGQVQFDDAERSVRKNNFYAANKAWNSIAESCAEALNHISGARLTKYRRLGVRDYLDAPLRLNRMSRDTLDTMWSTVQSRKDCLLRYFDAKSQLLGLEKLSWYDIQAPIPAPILSTSRSASHQAAASELSWDAACATVSKTLNEFSSDFGAFAENAMKTGWVEAENRGGKRQGGFCTGFPTRQQTRIFMTFTGSPDSMSTLAHELGHAYHSYVLREQPLLLRDYPMNLAETASTFAEAILGDRRLAEAQSRHEKLSILDNLCADGVSFLMNIHCRFLFEDRFHQERQNGEVSADRLYELMEAAQKEAYLNALDDNGWNPSFWISKLHFYISGWPFYNFPYTFGYLLSTGLYAMAREQGESFSEPYRQFLLATGCQQTEEAVQSSLGYDLTKPDFWNKSLDVIAGYVDQFVTLAEQSE
ncbi:MAG: M3 family oligoendopeptidase [Planctomycetaceae bacterium]